MGGGSGNFYYDQLLLVFVSGAIGYCVDYFEKRYKNKYRKYRVGLRNQCEFYLNNNNTICGLSFSGSDFLNNN